MAKLKPLIGLALALAGQLLFTACTSQELAALVQGGEVAIATSEQQPSDFSPNGGQQYGVKGSLSARQFAVLKGLAWPQQYDDMKGSFGFPSHRTETADYYALDGNPNTWVVVTYEGKTATGYFTEARP